MTKLKIDNKEFDLDALSDDAKAQLVSLQFCDQELDRIQAQAAAGSARGCSQCVLAPRQRQLPD